MRTRERFGWLFGFGAIATFVVVGLFTASAAREARAADTEVVDAQRGAQTPQPSGSGDQLAQGRQVYNRVCGRCHPGGEEDIGPRLINKNVDEAKMLKQIRSGSGRMRAINTTKLPDANVPALMVYLRSIHAVH